MNTLSSPNATNPLQRFGNPRNPRGPMKGKAPALVVRLTIRPFLCPVCPTLGTHSSRFRLMLVGPSICLSFESSPHAVFSYDHSGSSTHATRARLAGFLQLSVTLSPDPPDRTGLQRWVFSISPTSVPGSLFPILFTHGANSGFNT